MKSLLFRTRSGALGWSGIAALALVFSAAAPVVAQDDAANAKLRDQKLAEPWVQNAQWITDYDKALAASKESGKPIFGYFTRSYAP